MANLLDVDTALRRILAMVSVLPTEEVHLIDALDRVLAVDLRALIDLPPFANSSMDGYAVRSDDIRAASGEEGVSLAVVLDIPAGTVAEKRLQFGEAARIMTGAPMPDGADAVIPVEETDGAWERGSMGTPPERVTVYQAIEAGAYVRPQGEDVAAGTLVFRAGTRLRAQELGMLAALGQAQVEVRRQPKVIILSSGDELVTVDDPLTPGKIRDVNSYTLAGRVKETGGRPIVLPVARDTEPSIRAMFGDALAHEPDMIISSAGVSVGAADLIRDILQELGVIGFWRINLRPGKPLAFGALDGVPFMGLPGNPVSTMVTFDVLVRPALAKMAGRHETSPIITATLGESLRSDGRRSFIRVLLTKVDGKIIANITGPQSSGALMSMVLADGLLIVPDGVSEVEAGTALSVRVLRPEKLYALLQSGGEG